MTKEQMRKEIERMNAKIELEMEELANLANWMLSKRGEPETITFHSPSRFRTLCYLPRYGRPRNVQNFSIWF